MGLSWYTWLEQGRDVSPGGRGGAGGGRPSAQVLTAPARALLLSPSEERHLFTPAGVAPDDPPAGPVDPDTAALVDGLLPHLAFGLGPRFDVLAHNRAAELIMSDLVLRPRPNVLRRLFAGDGWDRAEWAATARAMEPSAKHITHRDLGPLRLRSMQTRPAHAPWLRLRILVPADDGTRATIAEALDKV